MEDCFVYFLFDIYLHTSCNRINLDKRYFETSHFRIIIKIKNFPNMCGGVCKNYNQ
jgi:hypothetical protein